MSNLHRAFRRLLGLGLLSSLLLGASLPTWASWKEVNRVEYSWGPFVIYRLALFSEDGRYQANKRPLMLQLEYDRPVDGRDFAISLGKAWQNLGLTLPQQARFIERLIKSFPDLKAGDTLRYIALPEQGYFTHNSKPIPIRFESAYNEAVLATWLSPKSDFSRLHAQLFSEKQPSADAKSLAPTSIEKPSQTRTKSAPKTASLHAKRWPNTYARTISPRADQPAAR